MRTSDPTGLTFFGKSGRGTRTDGRSAHRAQRSGRSRPGPIVWARAVYDRAVRSRAPRARPAPFGPVRHRRGARPHTCRGAPPRRERARPARVRRRGDRWRDRSEPWVRDVGRQLRPGIEPAARDRGAGRARGRGDVAESLACARRRVRHGSSHRAPRGARPPGQWDRHLPRDALRRPGQGCPALGSSRARCCRSLSGIDEFDAALSALALSHFVDPTGPVAELARVVRPGGNVVISDLHPYMVLLGGQAVFRTEGGVPHFVASHAHLPGHMLGVFREAGLTVAACIEPTWTALRRARPRSPACQTPSTTRRSPGCRSPSSGS